MRILSECTVMDGACVVLAGKEAPCASCASLCMLVCWRASRRRASHRAAVLGQALCRQQQRGNTIDQLQAQHVLRDAEIRDTEPSCTLACAASGSAWLPSP